MLLQAGLAGMLFQGIEVPVACRGVCRSSVETVRSTAFWIAICFMVETRARRNSLSMR
jgi:hypothetical protein